MDADRKFDLRVIAVMVAAFLGIFGGLLLTA
jgi:hypothetical protein